MEFFVGHLFVVPHQQIVSVVLLVFDVSVESLLVVEGSRG